MLRQPNKGWNPSHWASWKPFGIGEQYPNNYWEVFRAAWMSRDQLPYAWEILNKGVCDGCALGTTGMKDWTVDGIHVCNVRLRLLRMNTMPAFDPQLLEDVSQLQGKKSAELRDMGRLPYPMMRQRGEKGFRRVSWDEAMDAIASRIRATIPSTPPNPPLVRGGKEGRGGVGFLHHQSGHCQRNLLRHPESRAGDGK
jgi:anaerobic selenocysteine-containing dehydrogenase